MAFRPYSLQARFLMIFITGLFLVGWSLLVGYGHLNESRQKVVNITKQELSINKNLFVIFESQSRIDQGIEDTLLDIEEFEAANISLMTLKDRIQLRSKFFQREIEKGFNLYRNMKEAVVFKDNDKDFASVGIDLYIEEFRYFESLLNRANQFMLDDSADELVVSAMKKLYKLAGESLDKITLSYFKEFEYVSNHAQETIIEDQKKIESFIMYSSLGFIGVLCILMLVFYQNILNPINRGIDLINSIASGKRNLNDVEVSPDEMGDLVRAMKTMTKKIKSSENEQRYQTNKVMEDCQDKDKLLSLLKTELTMPINVLSKALHSVHQDGGISQKSMQLLELAEHESEHIQELLSQVQTPSDNIGTQLSLSSTNIRNYLEVITDKYRKKLNDHSSSFFLQISPEVPTSVLMDINRVAKILEFCLDDISAVTTNGSIRLLVERVKTESEEFLFIDISQDTVSGYNGDAESRGSASAISDMIVKKEIESADYSLFKKSVSSLGGSLEIKRLKDNQSEVRMLLPLITTGRIEDELTG